MHPPILRAYAAHRCDAPMHRQRAASTLRQYDALMTRVNAPTMPHADASCRCAADAVERKRCQTAEEWLGKLPYINSIDYDLIRVHFYRLDDEEWSPSHPYGLIRGHFYRMNDDEWSPFHPENHVPPSRADAKANADKYGLIRGHFYRLNHGEWSPFHPENHVLPPCELIQ
ncbi:hypothetical protein F4780DRAFT_774475 [Xylariomycetidae sp. FL0641]|nr:hypothetical protein F4780DRAFT_774475 [Xylariomycetidae sp. FL0641]